MASKLADYLTKQLFIEKNVVTFRSLSRHFNIHVNAAKRELATFYENARSTEHSYATYLISGEAILPTPKAPRRTQDGMDVDEEAQEVEEEEEDDGEVVTQLKLTLAGEQDLETARSGYSRIFSEHVYCLSPSPVLDVGLLCGPSDSVYATDAKLSLDESAVLGRVTGFHVQVGKVVKPLATGTRIVETAKKLQSTPSAAQVAENRPATVKKEETVVHSEEKPAVSKPKATGKLDFGKAKPKIMPEGSAPKVKAEKSEKSFVKVENKRNKPSASGKADISNVSNFFAPKAANKGEEDAPAKKKEVKTESPPASEPIVKRGIKRKSTLQIDTDTEQEPPPPSSAAPSSPADTDGKPDYKLKGNAILSDDEDELQPKPAVKGRKAKPKFDFDIDNVPSRSARSLQAMMDIDDDQVEKVARSRKTAQESSESADEQQDEDVMMAEDSDIPQEQPRRKRKEKKVIPVGRNGLKKKRLLKSRMTTDAKGYMVTEDYSEYESVEDEESEEEPAKPKKTAKAKDAAVTTESSKANKATLEKAPRKVLKPGTKQTGSSKLTHKGSLMNFFGKK